MKKRILVIERVKITHAIDIDVADEEVINDVVATLECDRIEDLDDAISRLKEMENVEIEGIEKEHDYDNDDIEIETVEAD